jgi:hypothetical protein
MGEWVVQKAGYWGLLGIPEDLRNGELRIRRKNLWRAVLVGAVFMCLYAGS